MTHTEIVGELQTQNPMYSAYQQPQPESYTQTAYFNHLSGRFSGTDGKTFWEKRGQLTDREGRQLAEFGGNLDVMQEQMRVTRMRQLEEGQKGPKLSKKQVEFFKKRKEQKKKQRIIDLQ